MLDIQINLILISKFMIPKSEMALAQIYYNTNLTTPIKGLMP
jgi:hypothetical protein